MGDDFDDLQKHLKASAAEWDALLAKQEGQTRLERYESFRAFRMGFEAHPVIRKIADRRQLRRGLSPR